MQELSILVDALLYIYILGTKNFNPIPLIFGNSTIATGGVPGQSTPVAFCGNATYSFDVHCMRA